eukprot:scaffold3747_cov152-Isochrysis_galbana.AAC.2
MLQADAEARGQLRTGWRRCAYVAQSVIHGKPRRRRWQESTGGWWYAGRRTGGTARSCDVSGAKSCAAVRAAAAAPQCAMRRCAVRERGSGANCA